MILEDLIVERRSFEQRTGWTIKPQGACKGEHCVPLPPGTTDAATFDVRVLAERLGMPVVRDDATGLYALGPQTAGRALETADAPDFTLPERRGGDFTLSSLRGQKVFLLAWASW